MSEVNEAQQVLVPELIARQARAARESVLLAPAPELAALVVTGADRVSWLNGLLTCELVTRKPGDVVYGLAVAKNGRILADMLVVIDREQVVLAVPRTAAEVVRASLEHYLVMEDAEIAPGEGAFVAFVADGPKARIVLEAGIASGAIGGDAEFGGDGGALVLAPRAREAEVRSALEQAAAFAGGVVGDEHGWDVVRVERGRPRFAQDFGDTTYPQEASLEKRAVSFSKGCYLGQEVVCMLEMRGHVKRKLAALVLDGASREVPSRGTKVKDAEGHEVGEVTSAAFSPTRARVVAIAMMKRAFADAGTELRIEGTAARVEGSECA